VGDAAPARGVNMPTHNDILSDDKADKRNEIIELLKKA
jgi:hypothetical protein